MMCIKVEGFGIREALLNAVVEFVPITRRVFKMQLVVWKFLVVFWSAVAVDKNNVILTHGHCIDKIENNEE